MRSALMRMSTALFSFHGDDRTYCPYRYIVRYLQRIILSADVYVAPFCFLLLIPNDWWATVSLSVNCDGDVPIYLYVGTNQAQS